VRDQPYARDAVDCCIVCGFFTVRHNSYEDTVTFAQSTLGEVKVLD
jgi:hypothetical protein